MKQIPIKICGLTREQDVLAAVDAGANAVGFVLYPPSPRCVTPERAAALAALLPAFVTPVLLFVNASFADVALAAGLMPGAWLQFHGDESPQFCENTARQLGRRWLRVARIPQETPVDKAAFDLVNYSSLYQHADALLLDTLVDAYGGSGHRFNWSQLPTNVNAHLVLSGGLTPANVVDGIRALHRCGLSLAVDVSSGVESAKGIKEPDKIRAFVAAVRSTSLAV
ncbi:MAG: phosphoribosylanthranilate isomerase [Limnohabitans sp.]|nr:phosphoribosylanthranilate isomerase [Limnohabitans sp.]